MLNLFNYLKIHQSVLVGLVLCSVLPLPAFAQQLPTFETEFIDLNEEAFPAHEREFIDPNSEQFRKYLLGPGDRLEIDVFGFEEFTALLKVILPDGNITMPLIGSFKAAGKTPAQIQQELTILLERDYLVDPVVTVALESLRPIVVNVAGEVERPGPIQLNSLTTNLGRNNQGNSDRRLPTVSAAVIAAGGVTRKADISRVVLRRSFVGGESVTTAINFWESLQSDAAVQDILLQDGDSIFCASVGNKYCPRPQVTGQIYSSTRNCPSPSCRGSKTSRRSRSYPRKFSVQCSSDRRWTDSRC